MGMGDFPQVSEPQLTGVSGRILMGSAEAVPYGSKPDVDYYEFLCMAADRSNWAWSVEVAALAIDDIPDLLLYATEDVTERMRESGREPGQWYVFGGWWPWCHR